MSRLLRGGRFEDMNMLWYIESVRSRVLLSFSTKHNELVHAVKVTRDESVDVPRP